jgi:hypothetical protein
MSITRVEDDPCSPHTLVLVRYVGGNVTVMGTQEVLKFQSLKPLVCWLARASIGAKTKYPVSAEHRLLGMVCPVRKPNNG